jgi:GNAT superfamily N-acetyltransferase
MPIRIVDVTDIETFGLVPPCADPGFDHRTCDYWEDPDRGSKRARPSWLEAETAGGRPPATDPSGGTAGGASDNPFAPVATDRPTFNPFAPDAGGDLTDNPFAPPRPARSTISSAAPRKLGLLGRGLAVFGSYAKVLLVDDDPVAYAQFGPLSAYPRALRLRQLYPQLPDAPLPAVITCIATTGSRRGAGHGRRLVEAVCDDLALRGFAAVEAYPEAGARPDTTSAATPAFWVDAGFALVIEDERYPVVRRELT